MGWFSSSSSSSDASPPPYEDTFSSDAAFGSLDAGSHTGFDSSSSGSAGLGGSSAGLGGDSDLQSFLMMEQQKAQMQSMIHKMNETCWEVCVGTPGSRLDARTETCVANCVDRFIDSSLFITNRFAQLLAKSGGVM